MLAVVTKCMVSSYYMKDQIEHLSGTVERIVYHNPENGFIILRVHVKGGRDLATVIGSAPAVSVGEYIQCSGFWHNDRTHGKQFKASFLKPLQPNTLDGIEKYLGSGLIKGIGPRFARKIVKAFGEKVFDVIEGEPELLSTIAGVGSVRAQSICDSWKDQKVIREIMIFLQSHGIGTARATRIYKTYGADAIEIVSKNPYQLARDIRGIGFISADIIAFNLGIEKNSLLRAQAGLSHVLLEAASNGHCYLPQDILIQKSQKLLEIDQEIIKFAIEKEVANDFLVMDTANQDDAIFLPYYHFYEKYIANSLLRLIKTLVPTTSTSKCIEWVEFFLGIQLADKQKEAINLALNKKIIVITGGPGTGKTTLINSLVKILEDKKIRVKLCAPTGRAAKRLSESTGIRAVTIHRLLEIDVVHGGFKRNEYYPLLCDYLIVDEMSMVDVQLFYSLLKALPKHSSLVLVGDVDQLPSIGAGKVLQDIIESNVVPIMRLNEIFRQVATSDIILNACRVNKGLLPEKPFTNGKSDFYFIEVGEEEEIINKISTMVKDRIPNKFNLHPVNDIQVLCPMRRGNIGAKALNIVLQKLLNPNCSISITRFGETFALGDKVMQIENNYDKEIYNGDIGVINNIREQELLIDFDNRCVVYDYTELDQIVLAYATTIHKSQGSEYPAVIIPITMQSFMMLRRELIYTGITRGKKLVIIIGQKKALAIAVKNKDRVQRYSKLRELISLQMD